MKQLRNAYEVPAIRLRMLQARKLLVEKKLKRILFLRWVWKPYTGILVLVFSTIRGLIRRNQTGNDLPSASVARDDKQPLENIQQEIETTLAGFESSEKQLIAYRHLFVEKNRAVIENIALIFFGSEIKGRKESPYQAAKESLK